jgi:glycogen operon protein
VGNTLNIWDPAALRLIMDALRYWVQDMHVDGFRFDLAASLAETDLHRSVSVFLDLVTQDPVLSPVKLIAEPWVPEYMLGRFPPMWSQWNDKFRNCVRDVWRSIPGLRQEFAWRVTGSPDIFCPADGEHPTASVNYAASHDGMTLHDIVSYTDDGEHAYGWGAEGDTGDPTVLALRRSAARNMLAMTLLSQGVPMLLHGDECGRTQGGNRNAYDRDDDTTYMQWSTMDLDLRAFCRRAIQLRRAHPVFRRQRFLLESGMSDETLEGIAWFAPDGHLMGEVGWSDGTPLQVSIFLDGQSISEVDEHGRPVSDDSFLVVVNAHWNVSGFVIPSVLGSKWRAELDSVTRQGDPADVGDIAAGSTVERAGRSFLVLRQT